MFKKSEISNIKLYLCVEVWGIFPETYVSLCLPTVETTKICLCAEEQTEGMKGEVELSCECYKDFYFIQRHTS